MGIQVHAKTPWEIKEEFNVHVSADSVNETRTQLIFPR